MKRYKKLLIVAIITVVTLGGILGGVAVANADEDVTADDSARPNLTDLLEKVADKYEELTGVTIEADKLSEAFTQVQEDIRSEALDSHLDRLVEEGKLTDEEAQEYKDWIDAKPDVSVGLGLGDGRFQSQFGKRFGCMFGDPFRDKSGTDTSETTEE